MNVINIKAPRENTTYHFPLFFRTAGHSDDSDYDPEEDEDNCELHEDEKKFEQDKDLKKSVIRRRSDTTDGMPLDTRHRHRDDGDQKVGSLAVFYRGLFETYLSSPTNLPDEPT